MRGRNPEVGLRPEIEERLVRFTAKGHLVQLFFPEVTNGDLDDGLGVRGHAGKINARAARRRPAVDVTADGDDARPGSRAGLFATRPFTGAILHSSISGAHCPLAFNMPLARRDLRRSGPNHKMFDGAAFPRFGNWATSSCLWC